MKPDRPLSYGVWETHRASNRQRKSPQWESRRQRHNYYKIYCIWWANKFLGGVTFGVISQAVYSPHLEEHLKYMQAHGYPLHDLFHKHDTELWLVPVVLGAEHGREGDDET